MKRRMSRIVLSLCFGIVLLSAGCTLAPRYTRPEAPIPRDWPSGAGREEISIQQGRPSVADISWRDEFPDERLRQVIELAFSHNRDVKLAALAVEKAYALFGVQRAEILPTAHLSASGSERRNSADLLRPGEPRSTEQYTIDFGIASWEVDFFGRIRSLKDAALEQYFATEEGYRGARLSLVSAVATAYLSLAANREMWNVARTTLDTRQEAFDLIRRRYEVGLASEIDLRRAQTQVDTARGEAARFERMVAQSENALSLLVGTEIPEHLLPGDMETVRISREISVGIPSDVLLRRPDIVAAEHVLKAAYANIGAARASFFPRISLTGILGTASDELSGLFGSGSDTWNFSPRAVMPIFDARTWSAYDVSKVEREIALAQYEKAIQSAFREVADALAERGTIEREVSAQESLVQSLTETYRLAEIRYEKGIDSYLSVLDAQRSLYAAQQSLIALRLARLVNQVTLYKVLGGGTGE